MKTMSIITIFLLFSLAVLPALALNIKDNLCLYSGDRDDRIINLKKGDIVFRYVDEELYPLFKNFMHPMLFTGNIVEKSGGLYYEFAEANGGKDVCYSYTSKDRILDKNDPALFMYIFRVNATNEQIKNAMVFAEWRINENDPFMEIHKNAWKHYNPFDNNSWYCTEYVWAAYFNCDHHYSENIFGFGIDIDANQGVVVWPRDIQNSDNIEKIPLFSYPEQPQEESMSKQFIPSFLNLIMRLLDNNSLARAIFGL